MPVNLNPTTIATGLTGNVASDVAQAQDYTDGPGAVVITSTVGATPTVTVAIQGSANGTNWFNVPYALQSAPTTYVITNITITTATTVTYLLQTGIGYSYLRLNLTANTNVTLDAKAYI